MHSEFFARVISGQCGNTLLHLVGRTLLTLLAIPAILILLSLTEGNSWSSSGGGLFQDWNIFAMFLVHQVSFLACFYVAHRYDCYVSRLKDLISNSSDDVRSKFNRIIEEIKTDIFGRAGPWKLLRMLLAFLGLSFVVLNAYSRYYLSSDVYADDFWTSSAYPISFWVTNIYTIIVWRYVSPLIAYVVIAVIAALWRLAVSMEKDVSLNLNILSSDHAGGLRPVSKLAASLAYVVLPFQLQLVVYFFWRDETNLPFLIGSSAIGVSTVIVFTLPIYLAHFTLVSARDRLVKDVAA